MLLGNYSVLNRSPLRYLGGSTASPEVNHSPNWCRGGARKNRQYVDRTTTADKLFSLPYGTYVPYTTLLPQLGGSLSARRSGDFSITPVATGGLGMPGVGSAALTILTNTPAGQLISSGSGSAALAFTVADALLTASVGGSGSAALALSTNTPILGAEASLTASGSFSITASNSQVLPLDTSSPLRTGTANFAITGALTPYAIGSLSGSTVDNSVLTVDAIASSVWESLASGHTDSLTMGGKLNTASSGGVDLNALAQAVWEYATRKVDVEKMNGAPVIGNGSEASPWRGDGVSV